MDIASAIVVYVLLWWLVFFMAQPVGVRVPDQAEVEVGHAEALLRERLLDCLLLGAWGTRRCLLLWRRLGVA